MILYDYFRSSTSYRVRIALNVKAIAYQTKAVNLLNDEHQHLEYLAINPQARVPTLIDGDKIITQSLAIINYLEQCYPEPSLFPDDPILKAEVDMLVFTIACDIHPINNLSVLKYLQTELDVSDKTKSTWYRHWIELSFASIEKKLQHTAGKFCIGDELTLADICLIPQVYNAKRFSCDMTAFPTITAINQHCLTLPAFQQATPEAMNGENTS